jgi:hypothetical protein
MTVYRLRVTLLPSSPLFTGSEDVWREIEVDDSDTLEALHQAIFDGFDRTDRHLYEFTDTNDYGHPRRSYVDPGSFDGSLSRRPLGSEEIELLVERVAPDDASDEAIAAFRDVQTDPPPEGDAAETTIADLDLAEGDTLRYLFDFGDHWEHTVDVRDVRNGALDGPPAVVEERGDSPPQYPDSDDL